MNVATLKHRTWAGTHPNLPPPMWRTPVPRAVGWLTVAGLLLTAADGLLLGLLCARVHAADTDLQAASVLEPPHARAARDEALQRLAGAADAARWASIALEALLIATAPAILVTAIGRRIWRAVRIVEAWPARVPAQVP
jgi:hypothetical protein